MKRNDLYRRKKAAFRSNALSLYLWTGIDSIIPPNSSPKTAKKNTSSVRWTKKWDLFSVSNRNFKSTYSLKIVWELEIRFDYADIVGWFLSLVDFNLIEILFILISLIFFFALFVFFSLRIWYFHRQLALLAPSPNISRQLCSCRRDRLAASI